MTTLTLEDVNQKFHEMFGRHDPELVLAVGTELCMREARRKKPKNDGVYKPWTTTEDNSADQDYIVGQSGSVTVIHDEDAA